MRPWLKRIVIALVLLALLPFVLVPVFAVVNPPVTVSQIWKALAGQGLQAEWLPYKAISRHLPAAVVTSEDARFCRFLAFFLGLAFGFAFLA